MAGAVGDSEAKDAAAGSQEVPPEGANGKLDDGLVYESYDPLRLQQNEGRELLPFPTFDAALDEFYAKVRAHSRPKHLSNAIANDLINVLMMRVLWRSAIAAGDASDIRLPSPLAR